MSRTLPIIIVLSITAALNFKSVRPIITGYLYDPEEFITDLQLHKDLKCAYLFIGLTHMRLTMLLFQHCFVDISIKIFFDIISYPNKIIKSQIATLHGLAGVSIGAMWILHLYTSLITTYHNKFKRLWKRKIVYELKIILNTQNYVITQLESEATSCYDDNFFDRYDVWYNNQESKVELAVLKRLIDENSADARKFLIINYGTKSLDTTMNETLKPRNLLMNHLGFQFEFNHDLMNVYNVQVNWYGTKELLENACAKARVLDWATDNLQNFKTYITLNFAFLKVIMFRLSWKHLMYSKDHIREHYYTQKWCALLDEFATFLHINDDPDIVNLLKKFYDMVNKRIDIDGVIASLKEMLHDIGASVGCEATKEMSLNGEEFIICYQGKYPDDKTSWNSTNSNKEEPIEYNSLANAEKFLLNLRFVFDKVDFVVIHSLLEYINKINQ